MAEKKWGNLADVMLQGWLLLRSCEWDITPKINGFAWGYLTTLLIGVSYFTPFIIGVPGFHLVEDDLVTLNGRKTLVAT